MAVIHENYSTCNIISNKAEIDTRIILLLKILQAVLFYKLKEM